MQKIDKNEYEKRIERISGLFKQMSVKADEVSRTRCPYKNRLDQCTACFGCRNQRRPADEGQPLNCVSEDGLEYRSAWETDPAAVEKARRQIQSSSRSGAEKEPDPSVASVTHDGQSRASEAGKTVFDFADELSVQVPTSCGRTGHCHECIVDIRRGSEALSERTEAESFLKDGYRLACQAEIRDATVDVEFALLQRTPRILTTRRRREVDLDPAVVVRDGQVYYDDEAIDKYQGHVYGLAIDVGTTTVVAELVDLETGEELYLISFENPQRFGGSDVMHRISYDGGPYTGEMHKAIINTLNTEIRQMCGALGIDRRHIYEIVIVGNATMRDLFFGLDVQAIGERPYKSIIEQEMLDGKRTSTSLLHLARRLRLYANKNARVFGAPLIASHIGADVVADLVAIDMEHEDRVVMLADVGTNTEVIIGTKDRMLAASCPAGPAFEGGAVTYGMPGCEGAIESLKWNGDRFDYSTIGGKEPLGICGSGLIDLMAELLRHGMMRSKCEFADKARQFDIVPDHGITFSRADASELAQAKGANAAGQAILMRNYGVTPDQVSKMYLAGGFANYVDPANAVDIGFLAPVPLDRIEKIGNAAARGARELLLSCRRRASIEKLLEKIEHVELETTPDFFEVFVEACQIKRIGD